MNETFKIKSTGFDEIKKQSIRRAVPILLIAMIFGIAIPFFNSENKEDVWYVLPFVLPIMIFALWSGINKGLKRQKMLFESYLLIFSENAIVREQANTPIVSIQIDEIKSIIKDKKGGYSIKGKTAVDTILIPAQIENFEKLEILFDQIKPIDVTQQLPFAEKYKFPIAIIMLGSMATVYVSLNKILVGICALICCTLFIWFFIEIRKNKNMDHKSKRVGYYLLFILLSILGVTYMKLTTNF